MSLQLNSFTKCLLSTFSMPGLGWVLNGTRGHSISDTPHPSSSALTHWTWLIPPKAGDSTEDSGYLFIALKSLATFLPPNPEKVEFPSCSTIMLPLWSSTNLRAQSLGRLQIVPVASVCLASIE